MTATKILWGQILIVFVIVLATIWLATQGTAWRLGFQSQLGPPWFEFAGGPVYVPVTSFWWWYHYDAHAPRIFLDLLVGDGGKLEACRTLFGDDSQDYQAALERHYAQGPLANWQERFVSAYATSHPWEDFAETWAHYLHIVDTLE